MAKKAKTPICDYRGYGPEGRTACQRAGPVHTDGGRNLCDRHAATWASDILATAIKPSYGFSADQQEDLLWAARRLVASVATAFWAHQREEPNP